MPKAIVTGAAGFIGCNTVAALLARGWEVVGVDNLSRPGSALNLEWLQAQGLSHFHQLDLTDAASADQLLNDHADALALIHLAGQVAVTSSIIDPVHDFRNNLGVTMNVLEACRRFAPKIQVLFSSTNKVYGGLEEREWEMAGRRYILPDFPNGIPETAPLDFHSPYGCSKGAADQYVHDYFRIYGLRTTVFRQSCIYGERQLGVEDQGWVAWFLIALHFGKPITLYGDGCQVRDLLFVQDLVGLYLTAIEQQERCAGRVYNVGGGPANAVSLLEFFDILRQEFGYRVEPQLSPWRPGDQRSFVADTSLAGRELGWTPTTSVREGIRRLHDWIGANEALLRSALNLR